MGKNKQMLIAIHQPNFLPPMPYFVKMAVADKFVFMIHCQYSKNGFQDYQDIMGKRWSLPTKKGLTPIAHKKTERGLSLYWHNINWIGAIAGTLGIGIENTTLDWETEAKGTERIIEICKRFGGDEYLASADAPSKYLDVATLNANGIEFVPFHCAEKRNVLEMFHECGIERTIEIFNRCVKEAKERCEKSVAVL